MIPTTWGPGRRAVFRLWVAVWVGSAIAGFAVLARSESKPGSPGREVAAWPAASRVRPEPGRYNLVTAVTPRCPCTAATVEEIARLVARNEDRLAVVVLVTPDPSAAGDSLTPGLAELAATPHVRLVVDNRGAEASRYGAVASGHVAVFDPSGRLAFRGGLTAARGRFGDNPGRQAVEAVVHGRAADQNQTPVYGCPIIDQ